MGGGTAGDGSCAAGHDGVRRRAGAAVRRRAISPTRTPTGAARAGVPRQRLRARRRAVVHPEDLGRWASFIADPDTPARVCSPPRRSRRSATPKWCTTWTPGPWPGGSGLMLHRRGERVLVGHNGAMPGSWRARRAAPRAGGRRRAGEQLGRSRPGGAGGRPRAAGGRDDPDVAEPWRPGPRFRRTSRNCSASGGRRGRSTPSRCGRDGGGAGRRRAGRAAADSVR